MVQTLPTILRSSALSSLTRLCTCQTNVSTTNDTTLLLSTPRLTVGSSPSSHDSDLGLLGNGYVNYFLRVLALILISFLVRFVYQYIKIHYFPPVPNVRSSSASSIGSIHSLSSLEDGTLNLVAGNQIQAPAPIYVRQIHHPGNQRRSDVREELSNIDLEVEAVTTRNELH